MKKILATILAFTMIASLAVVFCVPAAAIDGEWIVYSKADHEMEGFEGDPMSIPGYEYTDEGLHVIPADWTDFKPGAGVQRKEKSDITEGVYMQVRVDEFTYDADGWFNFNIYSQSPMKPGKTDREKWGYGVQTLIRYQEANNRFIVEWKIDNFQNTATTVIPAENYTMDEKGGVTLEFLVEYDGDSFKASINGSAAPAAVIEYMNNTYKTEEAYVGFNFQNSVKGGKCECTVLAYGTDKESAAAPAGDDSREPWNNYVTIADIADASTIEEGKPAVFMNGNRIDTDTKRFYGGGGTVSTLEDDNILASADKTTLNIDFEVKNDVSYDIDDFPVMIVLSKNYCACEDVAACIAIESVNMYAMTGDIIGADADHKMSELEMSEEPMYVGDDSYLYFFCDLNDANWDAEGRINGARIDFTGVRTDIPGRNSFEVCYVAFFRTEDEAIAYTENYLTELGWEDDGNNETNNNDKPAGNETEAPATNETEAPNTNETEAPSKNETEATTNNGSATNENQNSGCGSVVGFGAVAVVAVATAVGFVTFKKKED